MSQNRLLIKAFDFVAQSSIFEEESLSFWCELMIRLYDRGLLYGCFKGDELMAIAGLCKVPEWEERYLDELPDTDNGSRLYIPFFLLESERQSDPMQLLRHYLKEHPEVSEILYCEKYRRSERSVKRQIRRRQVVRVHEDRFENAHAFKNKIGVTPPELINLREADLCALFFANAPVLEEARL